MESTEEHDAPDERLTLGAEPESAHALTTGARACDWTDRVAAGASIVTVAAMIATPLLAQGGRGRRMLSSVVVGGMCVTTTANAARRWGVARAAGAAGLTAVITAVVERIGTRTGVPFGRYGYTDALRPQVAHVPVIVPMAWFAMGLPSREAAHSALGTSSTTRRRLVLGSAAMTAWDLFLDPQMVGEGYWAWARRGAYRGIPLTNYLGWFATGLGIMAIFEVLLPAERTAWSGDDTAEAESHDLVRRGSGRGGDRSDADPRLVGHYGYVAVMQTLGFARFFRDPVVAAAGGAAMLPIAATAARNLLRGGR